MRLARLLGVAMLALSGCHQDGAAHVAALDAGSDAEVVVSANLAWHVVYEPFDDAWFLSGWGRDPSQVWLAGGPPDAPVLLRGADEIFDFVPVDARAPLWWVWGQDGVVYVVGDGATLLRSSDGASFARLPSPVDDVTYWGVWGSSRSDVWVVGGEPLEGGEFRGVVLHDEGDGELTHVDPLGEPLPALFKVWGTSSRDVWIVGDHGTVLHREAHGFARIDLGTTDRFTTVAGCAADDVWIVGGLLNGRVMHLADGVWADVSPFGAPFLNNVTCAQGVVWIVGWQGYVARWTGDDWAATQPTALDLHGVWASGPMRSAATCRTTDWADAAGSSCTTGPSARPPQQSSSDSHQVRHVPRPSSVVTRR